jgi:hypothetical protein
METLECQSLYKSRGGSPGPSPQAPGMKLGCAGKEVALELNTVVQATFEPARDRCCRQAHCQRCFRGDLLAQLDG